MGQLEQAVTFLLAGIPPGRHFDVAHVAVEVGGALVERSHQLVQGVEGQLGSPAQGQANDVPMLPSEQVLPRQNHVPRKKVRK